MVAAGIVLVVLFVVVPRRVRMFLTLLPPAIAIAATTPHTLHIANLVGNDPAATHQLGSVAAPVLIAAVVAGIVVALAGELEDRRPPSAAVRAGRLARGRRGDGADRRDRDRRRRWPPPATRCTGCRTRGTSSSRSARPIPTRRAT